MVQIVPKTLVAAVAPAWTRKRTLLGYILKRYHFPGAVSQKRQQLKLAQAANAAFGTTGKIQYKGVSMPAIAVKIAPQLTGSTGGMSRETRRQNMHAAAAATIARLQREVGGVPAA